MILLLEIHYLFTQSIILMIKQQIGEVMIWLPQKVLKSIYLILSMVLFRSFLTKPIFFLIVILTMTLSWQTKLTELLRVVSTHSCTHTATIKLFLRNSHSMRSVRIRSYSGTNFPVFGMNTERHF